MKTTTQVATVLLLLAITGWHVWCSLFAIYIALLGKQLYMLGVLVVILFPPIVLIRWAVRGRLMTADLFLVILAVLPGLILGLLEIMKPRSPNISWLAPLLVIYLLAPFLVARLRVSNGQPRHESAR